MAFIRGIHKVGNIGINTLFCLHLLFPYNWDIIIYLITSYSANKEGNYSFKDVDFIDLVAQLKQSSFGEFVVRILCKFPDIVSSDISGLIFSKFFF